MPRSNAFGDILTSATGMARTRAARMTTMVRNTVTERPLRRAGPYWATTSKLKSSMRGTSHAKGAAAALRGRDTDDGVSVQREVGQVAIAEPVLLQDRRDDAGAPQLVQRDAHRESKLAVGRAQRIARIAIAILEDELLRHRHAGNDLDR